MQRAVKERQQRVKERRPQATEQQQATERQQQATERRQQATVRQQVTEPIAVKVPPWVTVRQALAGMRFNEIVEKTRKTAALYRAIDGLRCWLLLCRWHWRRILNQLQQAQNVSANLVVFRQRTGQMEFHLPPGKSKQSCIASFALQPPAKEANLSNTTAVVRCQARHLQSHRFHTSHKQYRPDTHSSRAQDWPEK